MARAEKTGLISAEAVEQSIVSEVLSLKTRGDKMMLGFFANPQRRGHWWGDIVDMSNRVDLDDFISYRRNLVPENWRKEVDKDRQQITDGLIEEIDTLVDEESRARHIGHLQVFVGAYDDALYKIGKTDVERKFRLGRFLVVQDGGSTRGQKNCLLFACLASEYGNLALREANKLKRDVFLKRARFFHQASLFEGKFAGDFIFKGDESRGGPPAAEKKVEPRAGAGVEQVAAEWKNGLAGKGNELVTALENYMKEASSVNLINLLRTFTNLGVGVYLKRPEAVGEEEFRQQAVGFDEAAEVMMGYFRQILAGSESLVFNPLLKTYDDTVGWSNHLKLYFDQAVAFDQLISESAEERQRSYAILGAVALTRVGQLVFSRIPEGAKVDIEELREWYREAVERYLARLSLL